VAKTTRRRAQLRGQQLPAKKGKVRARLVQTAQIQDWDNLTPEQQQEALNWGIDIDVDGSSDSDEDMSGQASGSTTFTMAASGGGPTEEVGAHQEEVEDRQEAVDPQAVEEAVEAHQRHQQQAHRHPLPH
jgi:hypothetical protein